jgi:hypothetical protein
MIKPILFSTEMVKSILEGRKTQTRRIVKFPKNWIPEDDGWDWVALQDFHPKTFKYNVGDVLWVRETFLFYSDENGNDAVLYKAEPHADEFSIGLFEGKPKWKPSIFMPREAARIFLRIIDVRVERLQDIDSSDCIAEGYDIMDSRDIGSIPWFKKLWIKINGEKSWEANPFVWVVSFRQISKPENFK